MSGVYVGFDIGGTKCAAIIGRKEEEKPVLLSRSAFPTPRTQEEAMDRLCKLARENSNGERILGVGISAGNPMDAEKGMLLNPPNLPGWTGVSLTQWATRELNAPAILENDANACALAEWQWGAGKGSNRMVFITFGTGFGAGLILDGKLYRGACGNAGELGHWRLSEFGPSGYGKQGSFEGFCSGGGLRQLAVTIGEGYVQRGEKPSYWGAEEISAKTVALAARAGDQAAQEVFILCGQRLGQGLALLVDLLNPDCIVLGSIYARCEDLLCEPMLKALKAEALYDSVAALKVLPAELGEQIGDYAALLLAVQASHI